MVMYSEHQGIHGCVENIALPFLSAGRVTGRGPKTGHPKTGKEKATEEEKKRQTRILHGGGGRCPAEDADGQFPVGVGSGKLQDKKDGGPDHPGDRGGNARGDGSENQPWGRVGFHSGIHRPACPLPGGRHSSEQLDHTVWPQPVAEHHRPFHRQKA